MVRNLPASARAGDVRNAVWSLAREDPLEKEMVTLSNVLAWKIFGQRSLAGCSPWDHTVGHD